MYGQLQRPGGQPFVPGQKPATPGPTGPGVAIASAGVAVAYIVAILLLRAMWLLVGRIDWLTEFSYVAIGLIPLVYLAIVGRGLVRKAVGCLVGLIAVLADAASSVLFLATTGWPKWAEYLTYALGVVGVIATVGAWGAARRAGALWVISIPIGVGAWALMVFVVGDIDFGSAFTRWGWSPLFVSVVYVVPIVIGWVLELVTRGPGAVRPVAPVLPSVQPWQQDTRFGYGQQPPQYGQRRSVPPSGPTRQN